MDFGTRVLGRLMYPAVLLFVLGPALFFLPDVSDTRRVLTEVLLVGFGWVIIGLSAGAGAFGGRPLFELGRRSWALWLTAAFVVWMIIGGAFGFNPELSWRHGFSLLTVFLVGISLLGWAEQASQRRSFLIATLGVFVALQTVASLTQLLRFPWNGWAKALTGVAPDGPLTVLTGPLAAFSMAMGRAVDLRWVSGLSGNSNFLAESLVLCLPVVAIWALQRTSRGARIAIAVGLGLASLVLLATGCRAAILGLLVGGCVGAWQMRGSLRLDPGSLWKHPKGRLAVCLLGSLMLIGMLLVGGRLAAKLGGAGGEDVAVMSRLANWQVAADMWRAHPVMGTGLGTYKLLNVKHAMTTLPEGGASAAWKDRFVQLHNEPLQLLVEGGLVGFLLAFAAFGFWFREMSRNEALPAPLKAGLVTGVVALLATSAFGFPFHIALTGVVLLLVLVIGLARDAVPAGVSRSAWRPAYALAAVALCALVGGQGMQKLLLPLHDAVRFEYVARHLEGKNDFQGASEVYALAARHHRFRGELLAPRMQCLMEQKRYADMVTLTESSRRDGPGFQHEYWYGRALYNVGRYDDAESAMTSLVRFYGIEHDLGQRAKVWLRRIADARQSSGQVP